MGSITVNRTLFVGLGGQGQIALAAVKRRLVEAYGEIPSMVRFLALDSAPADNPAAFGGGEFHRISFPGAAEFVDENRDRLSDWFDYERIPRKAIQNCEAGAGQIPQLGRLLVLNNMSKILKLVTDNVTSLFGERIGADDRFACADSQPQAIFFGSIAGGTGSGSLLDLACAMRTVTRARGGYSPVDWAHHAFLVMPGVFRGIPNTFYVQRNGYAFLKQLDFVLSERDAIVRGEHGDLFKVTALDGRGYELIDPFDSVTLIGYMNMGENKAIAYAGPKDLAAAVAEAMYALTGQMQPKASGDTPKQEGAPAAVHDLDATVSDQDAQPPVDMGKGIREILVNQGNHSKPWRGSKKCWYTGIGVSTLRFPRLSFKAWAEVVFAGKLITTLSAGEASGGEGNRPEDLVTAFLTDRKLHELGEQNQIMDGILPSPRFPLGVPDAKSVGKAEDVERVWLANTTSLDTSLGGMTTTADANLAALLEASKAALENRYEQILRTDRSTTAGSFVNQLRGYFQDVRKEMNSEGTQALSDAKRHAVTVAGQKSKCAEAAKKLFGSTPAVQKVLDDYRIALVTLSKARADEIRCSRAAQFCTSMDVILGDLQKGLEARTHALVDLETTAAGAVHAASVALEQAVDNPCVISVYPDAEAFKLPQPNPADFYTWYREQTGASVTTFWTKPVGDAWMQVLAYARERRVADGLGSVSLVSTIASASGEKRSRCLQRAHDRSQPLLLVSKGKSVGFAEELLPTTIYYVAAHPEFYASYQAPPLEDRLRSLDVNEVRPLELEDRDNAYFFRHWGCVPAYALSEIPEMRAQYLDHTRARQEWCLHLDKRWQDVLADLDPDSSMDDSLWVWVLASSDIDYLQRVKRAVSHYSFRFEQRLDDGSPSYEPQNLGQGLVTARETFLANREWIEQCRKYIESAMQAAIDEKGRKAVLDDLAACRERLKTDEATTTDDARKAAINKDVKALASFIAKLQQ